MHVQIRLDVRLAHEPARQIGYANKRGGQPERKCSPPGDIDGDPAEAQRGDSALRGGEGLHAEQDGGSNECADATEHGRAGDGEMSWDDGFTNVDLGASGDEPPLMKCRTLSFGRTFTISTCGILFMLYTRIYGWSATLTTRRTWSSRSSSRS